MYHHIDDNFFRKVALVILLKQKLGEDGEKWDNKICLEQNLNHLKTFIISLPVFVSIRKKVFRAP